jgi:hypothetical protein
MQKRAKSARAGGVSGLHLILAGLTFALSGAEAGLPGAWEQQCGVSVVAKANISTRRQVPKGNSAESSTLRQIG